MERQEIKELDYSLSKVFYNLCKLNDKARYEAAKDPENVFAIILKKETSKLIKAIQDYSHVIDMKEGLLRVNEVIL